MLSSFTQNESAASPEASESPFSASAGIPVVPVSVTIVLILSLDSSLPPLSREQPAIISAAKSTGSSVFKIFFIFLLYFRPGNIKPDGAAKNTMLFSSPQKSVSAL